jgi:glutaminyl-peptide cyclotransferase
MVLKNRVLICLVVFMLLFALVVLALHRQPKAAPSKPDTPATDNKQAPQHKSADGQEITDSRGNKYTIMKTYSRPSYQYTQGFYYTKNGELLESTGLVGQSGLQYYKINDDSNTLTFRRTIDLDKSVFGEGCDLVSNDGKEAIFQLTWLSRKIFKYNTDLTQLAAYDMPTEMQEGWGLTHNPANNKQLIASDSSHVLFLLDWVSDPAKLKVVGKHPIKRDGSSMYNINEMEWAGDYIVANVYLTTEIIFIDLQTNSVVRSIDMSVLVAKAQDEAKKRGQYLDSSHCLNGIAFDPSTRDFYITGKYWPLVFKIKFPEEYLHRPRS